MFDGPAEYWEEPPRRAPPQESPPLFYLGLALATLPVWMSIVLVISFWAVVR